MPRGVATDRFNDRGFTFVKVDPEYNLGGNVFVHVSSLRDQEDAKRVVRGSRLDFEIVMVNRSGLDKPQARNVLILTGHDQNQTSAIVEAGRRAAVKFWHPQGYGFIVDEKGDHEYHVKAASVPGGFLRPGDIVQFDVSSTGSEEGRTQAVNVSTADWVEVGDPFYDMIDMGNPKWAASLKSLAEREDWNYRAHPASDPFVILRSYVKHTFLRLNELPSHLAVTDDEKAMSFNVCHECG